MPIALDIGFVLLPSFTVAPFAAMIDVLRLAADDGDGSRPRRARWQVIASGPVTSSAGSQLIYRKLLARPRLS